jgi:hypothetical protein
MDEARGAVMRPIIVYQGARLAIRFCTRGFGPLSVWRIGEDCADMKEHEVNFLALVGGNLQGFACLAVVGEGLTIATDPATYF